MTSGTPETDTWLSDDPINADDTGTADRLGRQDFVDASIAMLDRLRAQSDSSVVALIGPWGAGKSSVLNMIRNGIEASNSDQEGEWLVAEFNPWNYQDLPSLQAGFFTELESSLPNTPTWSKARESLSKIGHRVAPLGSLGSMFGLDASKIIEAGAEWIAGDLSLAAARRAAEKDLRNAGQPVLMIIDDLDRLAPDELLLVFKLIRLTGRLPYLYYLVTYDEDTLLDALSRTGLVGNDDPRRAVDYLEKIVQIRLDLPPLREQQTSDWVDSALNSFATRFQLSFETDNTRFGRAYYAHIQTRLNTPRSIKRYFSQVEAFFEPVRKEVDPVDFLLITWIRTAEPLLYELIAAQRGELLGTGLALTARSLLRTVGAQEKKKVWRDRLKNARVAETNIEGVADVLGQIFPRFDGIWKEVDPVGKSFKPESGRVAHPDYFDRFFAFGVPSEDISDEVVENAYREIVAHRPGPDRLRVEQEFAAKTSMIIGKLEGILDSNMENEALALLAWFVHRYHELDDLLAFVSSRHYVRWATARIFLKLDADQATAAIEEAGRVVEGLTLSSYWLTTSADEKRFEQSLPDSDNDPIQASFSKSMSIALDQYRTAEPFDVPDHIWNVIWSWHRLDKEKAAGWMRPMVKDGNWSVLDVIGRLIPAQAAIGSPVTVWRLDALDLGVVDDLVGIDFALDSLDRDLDNYQGLRPTSGAIEASPESRRLFALAELKHEREQRRAGVSENE